MTDETFNQIRADLLAHYAADEETQHRNMAEWMASAAYLWERDHMTPPSELKRTRLKEWQ